VTRAEQLVSIERDVAAVLDETGGARASSTRLLVALGAPVNETNRQALADVLTATSNHIARGVYGGMVA